MAGRGRGRGRGKKSPKKPAKKSSYRKKAPPNPTPPHLPSDDVMHHLIMMKNWTYILLSLLLGLYRLLRPLVHRLLSVP